MPKEEWGVKRLCPTTGKRFYDLNRDPIVSPYTGEVVTLDTGKGRTMVADAEDAQTKKLKETAAASEEDDLVLDDEEDSDADVDLGDDVLDDDDENDNVSLDELADVPAEDSDD
ncbi:MAG: TIGR02300 family protein [Pseudomonadota bacterium]